MEFRRSQTGDLDQIVRIAEDAKAFLRASGVSQWRRGTYPDRELFASDVANGIGYVLADGDRICAVCAVTFEDEPSYRHLVKGAWLTGCIISADNPFVENEGRERTVAKG